jgi:hypothetical protein
MGASRSFRRRLARQEPRPRAAARARLRSAELEGTGCGVWHGVIRKLKQNHIHPPVVLVQFQGVSPGIEPWDYLPGRVEERGEAGATDY